MFVVRHRENTPFEASVVANSATLATVSPPANAGSVTDVSMAWDANKIAGEHAAFLRADPVINYVRVLLGRNDLTRDGALPLDRKAAETMAAARAYAEASPLPKPEAAVEGVFA